MKQPQFTVDELVRMSAATPAQLQELGAQRVAEIKSDPEHANFRGVSCRALGPPPGLEGRNALRVIGSTEDRDHYGDVVRVLGRKGGKGWQLDHYKAQGSPVLWSHGISMFGGGLTDVPIAQAARTWRGRVTSRGVEKRALLQDIVYASLDEIENPTEHEKFGDLIFRLQSGQGTGTGKSMMGMSVGFIPRIVNVPETREEREALGLGDFGVEFLEQDLIEDSVTPIPANPFASIVGAGGAKAMRGVARTLHAEIRAMREKGEIRDSMARDFERLQFGEKAAEAMAERLRSRVFMPAAPAESEDSPPPKVRELLVRAMGDDPSQALLVADEDPDDRVELADLVEALESSEARTAEPDVAAAEAGGGEQPDAGPASASTIPLDPPFVTGAVIGNACAIKDLRSGLKVEGRAGDGDGEPDSVSLSITPAGLRALSRAVEMADFAFAVLDTIQQAVEDGRKDLDWEGVLPLASEDETKTLSAIQADLQEVVRRLGAERSGGQASQTGSGPRRKPRALRASDATKIAERLAGKS